MEDGQIFENLRNTFKQVRLHIIVFCYHSTVFNAFFINGRLAWLFFQAYCDLGLN
jgi:hypothetical protein